MDSFILVFAGILIILIAGFVQGLTSFGFALVSLPLLMSFMPFQTVVPIIVILSFLTNMAILYPIRAHVELTRIWPLVISSLVAAPFGAYILLVVEDTTLKAVTGVFIAVVGMVMLSGLSFPVKKERLAFVPIGITSGLLNGSISLSGPPVVLFLSNQGVDKMTFRANLTAYGLILNVVTVFSFAANGLLSSGVLHYSSWFVPAMLLGVLIGVKAASLLNEQTFRKITLGLIILSGLWTLFTAF